MHRQKRSPKNGEHRYFLSTRIGGIRRSASLQYYDIVDVNSKLIRPNEIHDK